MPDGIEIGKVLRTRHARIRSDDAGLPTDGDRGRVPGLRREEVALLAGVSVEYHTRIERRRVGAGSSPAGPPALIAPPGPNANRGAPILGTDTSEGPKGAAR